MNGELGRARPLGSSPPSRWRCRGATVALLVPALLYSTFAAAELVPPKGRVDARVRTAPYDAEQIYRLRGFVGYQIDLEFEAGETFAGLGAGDIDGLSFFGQDNHLFLKPKAAQVATNLTVLTNRRHYQFVYTGISRHPAQDDPDTIFALRFTYPPLPGQAAREEAARHIDAELENAGKSRQANRDYWYCGGAALKPVSAEDDGVHTRLRFAANADLPALFVRNDDDSESLLNYSMDNGDVVVHRVARRFVVRRGKLTGCIVNRGFTGRGDRLESGTVAPAVERTVQGVVP